MVLTLIIFLYFLKNFQKEKKIIFFKGYREKLVNESLGNRTKVENEALAYAESLKVRAEAEKISAILQAEGKAKALEIVGGALLEERGRNAASLQLAKEFIGEFGKIAEKSNSIIVPENISDVGSFIAKAMSIAKFSEGEAKK